nr:helitron helicase-like domain-containing protein [Tanacetum cinerariifolium]
GDSSQLDHEFVSTLIHLLDEHNELVRLFRTARDRVESDDVPEFHIRLFSVVAAREYDLLTLGTLGAIMFENGPNTRTDYDVIIESRGGFPQRINNFHPSYMSLQFPLLFVYGVAVCFNNMWLVFSVPSNKTDLTTTGYVRTILEESICLAFMTPFLGETVKVFRFLKDRQVFGSVTGLLYMIDFQKLGLPRCHTLVWVDSKDKIQNTSEVNRYISAELPDPDTNLEGYRLVSEMMVHGPCGLLLSDTVCMKEGNVERTSQRNLSHTLSLMRTDMFTTEKRNTYMYISVRYRFRQRLYCAIQSQSAVQILSVHLEDTRSGRWRQRGNSCLIGRLANVYPTFGELFFLRMLLCHQKRFKTFDDIRTVNKRLYPTFRAACEALGLLGDDKEWLWKAFWRRMSDDVPRTVSNSLHIQDLYMNDPELKANESKQEMIFVYDHGETGKTFLWRTLINAMRSEGKIVLVVASSGIA